MRASTFFFAVAKGLWIAFVIVACVGVVAEAIEPEEATTVDPQEWENPELVDPQDWVDPMPADPLCAELPIEAAEPLRPALILPGRIDEHVDGDTVGLVIEIRCRVRLKECWADEIRTTDPEEKRRGLASAAHLAKVAPVGERCTLYVPIEEGAGLADLFSFGRLVGDVFVRGESLAAEQVQSGHATKTKPR